MIAPMHRRLAVILIIAAALPSAAFAMAREIYQAKNWTYAVGGYDVVAYATLAYDAAPVPGSDQFVAAYKGSKWRFSSAANRDAFSADPGRYAPQYGGYCAWALARNKLAPGDPAVWHLRNGKLYLNVNKNIQKQWRANIDRDIANGDRYWPAVLSK